MASQIASFSFDQKYQTLQLLGQGTFASVQAAKNIHSQQQVAVKQIYIQKTFLDEAMEQVQFLEKLKNNHIVKIIDYFYDEDQFHLNVVLELCKTSLRKKIEDHHLFDEEELLFFLVQVISAFLELQNKKMMHLDFKPENILIADQEGKYYKICDFGCSQIAVFSKMSGYQKSCFGTFNYIAPQIFLNYSGKVTRSSSDVWALGITLYQMIFWSLPFTKEREDSLIDRKLVQAYFQKQGYQISYEASEVAPHKIINLIKLMLAPDPFQRISWKGLKQHLMKQLAVQQHEFLDIENLTSNFISTCQVYLKAVELIKQIPKNGKSRSRKENEQFYLNLSQILIYYLYIICQGFSTIFQIKGRNVTTNQQKRVRSLLNRIMSERQSCRDPIKEYEKKDLNYREMQLIDELKVCLQELKAFGKQSDLQITILTMFCQQLKGMLTDQKALFMSQQTFKQVSHLLS